MDYRSTARRVLLLGLLASAVPPCIAAAQRLAPIGDAQRCDGRPIVAVEFVGARRPLLSHRFDPAARIANEVVFVLQPPTRVRLLQHFILLHAGDVCDEQRRVESERILRAQPYISDAALRVLPADGGQRRLRVETIDEYVLYFESWGWQGLPAGVELGTASVAGSGKGFRLLAEVDRGNKVGWGVRFKDTQFLGQPVTLDAAIDNRPRVDQYAIALTHPFYTNFQRYSWHASAAMYRSLYPLLDTALRNLRIEYERRTIALNSSRRLGPVNAPWNVGVDLEWERAAHTRTLQQGDNGTVPIATPPEVGARYPFYDVARIGTAVGYRQVRFHSVRGLGALSAPEDVAIGHDDYVGARTGIGALQRGPTDQMLLAGSSGAMLSGPLLLRWTVRSSWIARRAGAVGPETSLEGRSALSLKLTEGHLSLLSFDGATFHNARVPTQLNFRNDETGLLGYRTTDVGGAARVIVAFEERHRLPLQTRRVEIAVAALAQTGRLWAGDAPFGVTTPWRSGVGMALMTAIPAGAKQSLRIEFGIPVHPPPGLQGRELRIFYSDRTGRF